MLCRSFVNLHPIMHHPKKKLPIKKTAKQQQLLKKKYIPLYGKVSLSLIQSYFYFLFNRSLCHGSTVSLFMCLVYTVFFFVMVNKGNFTLEGNMYSWWNNICIRLITKLHLKIIAYHSYTLWGRVCKGMPDVHHEKKMYFS